MKEKIIIYGFGNTGRSAYHCLKERYDVLFFVDKDSKKWGDEYDGVKVYPPSKLVEFKETMIIIASIYKKEILQEISSYQLKKIRSFSINLEHCLCHELREELANRTINLGKFLQDNMNEIRCKQLTFQEGGSGVLDYAFLKKLAELFKCKEYLEIGTHIGESINIMSECCERLYSITAPLEASFSSRGVSKYYDIPDFSDRLTYSDKIVQFYIDSKQFDFSLIGDKIDLYFIDGDHSYEGVYQDTKNIFQVKKDDAIVVWHDFFYGWDYNGEIISAVKNVLQEDFENVYITNNNACGVYIPPKYKNEFVFETRKYSEDAILYTYDCVLTNFNKI